MLNHFANFFSSRMNILTELGDAQMFKCNQMLFDTPINKC